MKTNTVNKIYPEITVTSLEQVEFLEKQCKRKPFISGYYKGLTVFRTINMTSYGTAKERTLVGVSPMFSSSLKVQIHFGFINRLLGLRVMCMRLILQNSR